jgi:hypothetical protein
VNAFIPQPWDEPHQYRWTREELDSALALQGAGRNYSEIADALAEAGYPPRCETNVEKKLREVA